MKNLISFIVLFTLTVAFGTAYAGDVIAPPVSKYVDVPLPPKRPANFGKIDSSKVAAKINETVNKK